MKLREYQREVSRTFPKLATEAKDFQHMNLGIVTEVAELLDIVKKHNAYGKELDTVHIGEEIGDLCWYVANYLRINGVTLEDNLHETEYEEPSKDYFLDIDPGNFLSYIAIIISSDRPEDYINLLIYAMQIADMFELDFEEILAKNIAKLRVRYPDKFSKELAIKRNIEKERKELE